MKNQININENHGAITITDEQGVIININAKDPTDALQKLGQLQQAQIDALLQAMDKHTANTLQTFKVLLSGFAAQKNIIKGNIGYIGRDLNLGDRITKYEYHIHPKEEKYPSSLTSKILSIHESELIGRTKDLEAVRKLLVKEQRVVVVNGLGGIGKTALAQAYIGKYGADYAHKIWITQSEQANFPLDVINAEGLTQRLKIDRTGKDTNTLFQEILATLEKIEKKPNLWIIDNATANLRNWKNYLPKQPNWHILATSREKIENFHEKSLGFLAESDAVILFKKYCTLIKDEEAIKAILKTIDYHTLTIEILAKTAQRRKTNPITLQQAIEKDLKAQVYVRHNAARIERVTAYLLSIFDCSDFDTAAAKEEKWLLQQLAVLPAEYHSFQQLIDLILDPTTTLEEEQREDIAATLTDLHEKGWLLYNTETEQYKMHRIIQTVILRKLRPSIADVEFLITNVTTLLSIDDTKDNPIDKFQYIPYGKAITTLFDQSIEVIIIRLQNNLAVVFKFSGDYQEAKKLLEKVMHIAKSNFGENHLITASSYSNLGLILQDLGDYVSAKKLLEKAMYCKKLNLGADHPDMALVYSNLGLVLHDLGDYVSAKSLLEKTMYLDKLNFEANNPIMASTYSNLAVVLKALGDYTRAKKLLEKAMCLDELNFGTDHPNTARTYSNLGLILKDLGDYSEAKKLLEKAIYSDESNFGGKHPNTAVRYSNLGLVLQDLGDYIGARNLLEKAMHSDELNFGVDHPNTARTYSNLGMVLQDLGDYVRARNLLEKAMYSDELNFGSNNPTTASTYSNLAMVLYHLDEYEQAILLAFKAYRIQVNFLDENHPTAITIVGVLDGITKTMLEKGWTMKAIQEVVGIKTYQYHGYFKF